MGAVRQQAITWANVDPDICSHIALLGHNAFCWYKTWFGVHLNGYGQIRFYPAALKGSGVLSSPERAGGRADKPR